MVLESGMFLFQLAYYTVRPQDKSRAWYLVLLLLMLFYNLAGGLFPDPKIPVPVAIQEMIAYGSGFLTAAYFPFYFYKAFGLKQLRWHALFGVPLFLMLPYLVFFIVIYAINGNLDTDIKYGMIVPFVYALVLLWRIFTAIRRKYEWERNRNKYLEEIAMNLAVMPWASLAFFGLVEESQLAEVLCTNTGIIFITILFIHKAIKQSHWEYELLRSVAIDGTYPGIFWENCRRFGLTKTEVKIVEMLYEGLSNKNIADKIFISEETVKKHIYNMFRKTRVKSRTALIHALQNLPGIAGPQNFS